MEKPGNSIKLCFWTGAVSIKRNGSKKTSKWVVLKSLVQVNYGHDLSCQQMTSYSSSFSVLPRETAARCALNEPVLFKIKNFLSVSSQIILKPRFWSTFQLNARPQAPSYDGLNLAGPGVTFRWGSVRKPLTEICSGGDLQCAYFYSTRSIDSHKAGAEWCRVAAASPKLCPR